MLISHKESSEIMRSSTGVTIPVYFPEGVDCACAEALLEDTVDMFCRTLAEKKNICLSVDGEGFGGAFARKLADKYGVSIVVGERNAGKLCSVGNGVRFLLENSEGLKYVSVVDQDGDHFANELVNFLRAALHIKKESGEARILIIGRRISKHRPMGFLRGELEELADRVLLDALHYRAFAKGKPLRMEFANMLDEYPDFHSGYKLFSADVAKNVFMSEKKTMGLSEECYSRHACEAVMTVEALENGAILGLVNRSTVNEQPVSTFGLYKRERMVADKIIWPCKRLDIPDEFVRQWMANHSHRLLLSFLAPDGRGEIESICSFVEEAFPAAGKWEKISQPLFL